MSFDPILTVLNEMYADENEYWLQFANPRSLLCDEFQSDSEILINIAFSRIREFENYITSREIIRMPYDNNLREYCAEWRTYLVSICIEGGFALVDSS